MYYRATPAVRDNLLVLVSQAQVKGVDAAKVVKLAAAFKEPVKGANIEPNYYQVDDDSLIKFAIDVVNNSVIRGSMAVLVLNVLDMLNKPIFQKSEIQSSPTPVASASGTVPLAPVPIKKPTAKKG